MKTPLSQMTSKFSFVSGKWLGWAAAGLIVLVVVLTSPYWFGPLNSFVKRVVTPPSEASKESEAHDEHAGHDHAGHDHAGHDESQSIELSPQARMNIGLRVDEIKTTNYSRSITIPAIVAERPGRTHQKISAPMTGVANGVHVIVNEVVTSGDVLFNLRLTHEDLVKAQTEFIANLGRLDVEQRELARLEKVSTGVLAQKVLLERQYEIDKLQAILKAERHSLLLHGLTDEQVHRIEMDRALIREMQVRVPFMHADSSVHSESEAARHQESSNPAESPSDDDQDHKVHSKQFVVTQLDVLTGEAVETGQSLCVLADYGELFIEGQAFEQDANEIVEAANAARRVKAYPEQGRNDKPKVLEGLEIVHVNNEVDRESRALHFYVNLPNEIVRESERGGHKFITWRFKPGQRMQLRVPVEEWKDVIVLPVDAVAQEGPETFVFVENGDHFDRQPVHVKYRDQHSAVIANDGSIFPGDRVAFNGAHQLQMALKNKAGGGVDPHAGHSH